MTRLVPANTLVAMNTSLAAKNLQLPDSAAATKAVAMDTNRVTKPVETVTKPVEFPAPAECPMQEHLTAESLTSNLSSNLATNLASSLPAESLVSDVEGEGIAATTSSLLDTVMTPAVVGE